MNIITFTVDSPDLAHILIDLIEMANSLESKGSEMTEAHLGALMGVLEIAYPEKYIDSYVENWSNLTHDERIRFCDRLQGGPRVIKYLQKIAGALAVARAYTKWS